MIESSLEINRILLSVDTLSVADRGANEHSVIDSLDRYCIRALNVDSKTNINFCLKIGLLHRIKNRLIMTHKGKEFFDMRTMESQRTILDLNSLQKQYLLKLLFDSPLEDHVRLILSDFRLDFSKKVWFYDSKMPKAQWPNHLVNFLLDCEFLRLNEGRIEVHTDSSYLLSKIRHKVSRSEEELLSILDKQRIIGAMAEELTVNYEKKRLSSEGFGYLSLAVHRISTEDVFAGFDIISYNGEGSTLEHDRFIEVKGTSGSNPAFYWSRNEIETAKKCGDNYWIYLWTEVGSNSRPILSHTIKNPYLSLFKEREKKPEPVLYAVQI